MKKYIFSFLVALLLVVSPSVSLASITLNPSTNPQADTNATVEVSCSQNQFSSNSNIVFTYSPSGNLVHTFSSCFTSSGFIYGSGGLNGDWTFFECDGSVIGGDCSTSPQTLLEMQADAGVITSLVFTFGAVIPPSTFSGLSIFGGTAPSVGTPLTSSDWLGQTATAVQATTNTTGPVIALVAGMIIALVVASYVISIFRETDVKTKQTKNVNKIKV